MIPDAPSKPYRMLTLDGGGTWALIQGKALGAIYGGDTDGWRILDRFDFAAANSGGALVLALLLKGLTPNDIVNIFRDQRERSLIFEKNRIVDRALGGLLGVGPRYHAPGKFNGLMDIFARSRGRWGSEFAALALDLIAATLNLERAQTGRGPFHFLIAAYDFDAERTVFFRSNPNSAAAHFRGAPVPTLAGALHATTNAPVRYFNRPAEVEFADGAAVNYWDGAVGGYNNPIMAAVMEALATEPARRETMQVLSLGTSNTRLPVVAEDWPGTEPWVIRRKRLRGLDSVRVVSDLRRLTAAVMSDRPEAASYMAHIALGERLPAPGGDAVTATRIVRMSPMVQPRHGGIGRNGLPQWVPYEWFGQASAQRGKTLFERLVALDMDAVNDDEVQDIERLADLWLEGNVPNQPIHSDDRFVPVIGHGAFGDALARWKALDRDSVPVPQIETAPAPRPSGLRGSLRRFRDWIRPRDAVPAGPVASNG